MKLEHIDTSTTSGKARVMQLAAEGRDVAEASLVHGPLNNFYSKWSGTSFPVWDWRNCKYAIIAEPVGPDEVWVPVFSDGELYGYAHKTKEAAMDRIRREGTVVRYRRVEE